MSIQCFSSKMCKDWLHRSQDTSFWFEPELEKFWLKIYEQFLTILFLVRLNMLLNYYRRSQEFWLDRPKLQITCNDQRWSRRHKARGQGQGHKKIRGQGQGQPFRGQNLSRPRTGMLEAKAKDQGHRRKCSPKKKKTSSKIFFRRSPIHRRTQNFCLGEV